MEPSIRSTAHEAVLALVKGLPHLRNMMLVSYVSCLSNLNDDQHQVRVGLFETLYLQVYMVYIRYC